MGPILHATDEAVLDRIDVAIFHMTRVIGVVPDQVLPKPSLPDAAFAPRLAHPGEPLILRQRFREPHLDQPPARGEIRILRRQRPDRDCA